MLPRSSVGTSTNRKKDVGLFSYLVASHAFPCCWKSSKKILEWTTNRPPSPMYPWCIMSPESRIVRCREREQFFLVATIVQSSKVRWIYVRLPPPSLSFSSICKHEFFSDVFINVGEKVGAAWKLSIEKLVRVGYFCGFEWYLDLGIVKNKLLV